MQVKHPVFPGVNRMHGYGREASWGPLGEDDIGGEHNYLAQLFESSAEKRQLAALQGPPPAFDDAFASAWMEMNINHMPQAKTPPPMTTTPDANDRLHAPIVSPSPSQRISRLCRQEVSWAYISENHVPQSVDDSELPSELSLPLDFSSRDVSIMLSSRGLSIWEQQDWHRATEEVRQSQACADTKLSARPSLKKTDVKLQVKRKQDLSNKRRKVTKGETRCGPLLPHGHNPGTDILCGRGAHANNNAANKRFLRIADNYVTEYRASKSRKVKALVVGTVLLELGDVRFVDHDKAASAWRVLTAKQIYEKIGTRLRGRDHNH